MGLKKYEEISEAEKWNLKDIFNSVTKWREAYIKVEEKIENWKQELLPLNSAEHLLSSLKKYNELLVEFDQVFNYAFYKFSEDETDTTNQTKMEFANELLMKSNRMKIGYTQALLSVPDKDIKLYMRKKKELNDFSPFLNIIEKNRSHMLSPKTEDTLAVLNQVIELPSNSYLTVAASDMKFDSVTDKEGVIYPISLHKYMTQIETSPDTILRRNAYSSLTKGMEKYKHGLASNLITEINKNVKLAKLRGYQSSQTMLLQGSFPTNEYDTDEAMTNEFFEDILDTFMVDLSPHMQRYAKLRRKSLGLDELFFSDIKAPLDPEYNPSISYEKAGEIITNAVAVLGEEYQENMNKVFKERWVYRGDNIGRRMIAFGGGVHGVHGYAFYPWGGNLFDLFLLGHELGHTLHYTLSAQNQRIINNTQQLLFVEAPSTLIEHLIVNYLQEHAKEDKSLQRWLYMYLMMSYHHNCVTHVLEAELLRRLYIMAENKKILTTEIISNTKRTILYEFWGDEIIIDKGAELSWMRQPHYYMGLYPFTYSIGMSASTIISENIKKGGRKVGECWTEILKKGGSLEGFDLYEMAGVNMSTVTNIKKTISHVGNIVDYLEKDFKY